jgi:aspartyl-tRNA(Asn)/glutamyl-tRNA(Gln) amidotransferase subunit A
MLSTKGRYREPEMVSLVDPLAPEVPTAFFDACTTLSRGGARVVDLPLTELGEYRTLNACGGFAPIEAFAWHRPLLARCGDDYDPRVRSRIERGGSMTAVEYIELSAARADLIARVAACTADFDALLTPTVAITAPPIAALAVERYFRLNALILSHTSIINFLDRCAITLPIHRPGAMPVGLMVIGEHGEDRRLLAIAAGIEVAISAPI